MKSSIAALATLSGAQANDYCRVLALSSGDEDAAYQAGALKGIVTASQLQAEDFQYDSITGVSGGALNAVLLSNFTKGEENNAADRMEQFWRDAANNELYKDWVGGLSRGLFFEGGLYNSEPLEKFLKQEFIDVNVKRNMTMGIVDVADGLFKEFTDKNITQGGNLIDAMYASMSFAGFFPPAEVLDSAWFDGSGVWDLDIFSGVNRCKEAGFEEKDIVIDVILTSAANLKQVEAEDYKSVNMLFRYLEISSYYNSMDALLRSQFTYKDANFRYVIAPTGEIPSSFHPLSLNETEVNDAFAMGVKDAQDVIAKGSKQSLKDLLHYYAVKKSGKGSGGRTLGQFLEARASGEIEELNFEDHSLLKKYAFMTK